MELIYGIKKTVTATPFQQLEMLWNQEILLLGRISGIKQLDFFSRLDHKNSHYLYITDNALFYMVRNYEFESESQLFTCMNVWAVGCT